MAYNNSRNPLRALHRKIGELIVIRLKDGTKYIGKLKEYDDFMNLIISDAKEYINDEEKGSFEDKRACTKG